MNGWNEGIARAIDYIEANLTEKLDIQDIARQANVSAFYFQRIFTALCGFTVGEYIRSRRLTLAGQALSSGNAKVIDVAFQYGYDSPDGFARAFTRFHGISPSAAREPGAVLNAFAPLKIKLTLEGGTMLEYKIEEKEAQTFLGISRTFQSETGYRAIPQFWAEHMASPTGQLVRGYYGICMDNGGTDFHYLIADAYSPGSPIPEGCQTVTIPAGTWAVFPCKGQLPEALQSVNTRIWSEWLPSCRQFRLAGNYNVEAYFPGDYCEIWIPVARV